jgi:hypothetical protein
MNIKYHHQNKIINFINFLIQRRTCSRGYGPTLTCNDSITVRFINPTHIILTDLTKIKIDNLTHLLFSLDSVPLVSYLIKFHYYYNLNYHSIDKLTIHFAISTFESPPQLEFWFILLSDGHERRVDYETVLIEKDKHKFFRHCVNTINRINKYITLVNSPGVTRTEFYHNSAIKYVKRNKTEYQPRICIPMAPVFNYTRHEVDIS